MGDAPYNAGQTFHIANVVKAPVSDVDCGTITVRENWGRLFIEQGGAEIMVLRSVYPDLRDVISHFIEPPTASQAGTARQEGVSLGLAMAKAAPRFVPSQSWIAGEPFREAVWAADIPEPPIPPHVAAARVLLDAIRQAEADGLDAPIGARFREALEQLAREGE